MTNKLEVKIVGLVFVALLIASAVIGLFSTMFIKTDINTIVDMYSRISQEFIVDAFMETMVSGNADSTRRLLAKHSKTDNVSSVKILDPEGREALSPTNNKATEDLPIIKEIRQSRAERTIKSGNHIIYYTPLLNTNRCVGCHADSGNILGVMKVSVSIKTARQQMSRRISLVVWSLFAATILFGLVLWYLFRMTIIVPIKKIEDATIKMSGGDLSFKAKINTTDEIGRLSNNLKKALTDIGEIIKRVRGVSMSVVGISKEIEMGSTEIVEGSHVETKAMKDVINSVEEFEKSITTIAMTVEDFSVSAIDGVTASNDMLVNTEYINGITIELSEAVDSTSSSIEEISANIKDVAQRSEELSSSSEEAISAITQIKSSINEIETSTKESSKLAEKAASDASRFGIAAVQKTSDAMEKIKLEVFKAADLIEKLEKRSKDIGKILDVIDDITDQTSLLSFNAAILAAQSGEHGKGFAVVADEIKALAKKTSFSTQEISLLIHSVQSETSTASIAMSAGMKSVEEGSMLTDDAKNAFEKIVDSLKDSTEKIHAVERATSEQSKSISFVSDTMERFRDMISRISKATSEHSDGIAQIVLASEKISAATQTVRKSTGSQLQRGKELAGFFDNFSEKAQDISTTLKGAKENSDIILKSITNISSFPEDNRKRAFTVNRNVGSLMSDAEILMTELKVFKITEERDDTSSIKFGVIPLESPSEMYKRFLPLNNYLSRKLDKRVMLKIEANYDNTLKDIGMGNTDICYMTPSTYIKAKHKYGVEVILKALKNGKPFQRIAIIARKGGDIQNMSDIEGKSFAFGDILSTSSYILPRAMLDNVGIDLDSLSYYDFLGHHDDVARAVLKGEFNAGGVMESTAEKFKADGLNIIEYSMNVPEFNICVNKNIPSDLKSAIKQAILELTETNPDDKAILQSISPGYTGFIEAQYEDYKGIKEMMEKLGVL
jgi:methyl-accepting chemotaxis protein